MIQSRITSKSQTTVPQAVRRALGIQPGDALEYVIDGEQVWLRKADTLREEDPFAHFEEWASEADREAYAGF